MPTFHSVSGLQFPDCRPLCKSFVKRAHTFPDALRRSAKKRSTRFLGPPLCLAAVVPAFAGPDIYWLSRAFFRPSQMIESVFTANPETNQKKPPEIGAPLL